MASPVILRAPDGTPFNARVDLEPRGLILHSRSGKDRNRDYRPALELILARLDAAEVKYDIYLDSAPVQVLPLDSRRVAFPRSAPVPARFSALVQAMNAGSASNGAWRRLLISAPGLPHTALLSALQHHPAAKGDAERLRLPASELRKVTPEHVDRAVSRLLSGEDAPNFAPSRDFDLLAPGGDRLPPKKVFGLALENALGIEPFPGHFSAGIGTPCFQVLESAGYPVVPKGDVIQGNGVQPVDPDLALAEGTPKLVTHLKRERNPALAAAKRRAMINELGHLKCERCKVVPSTQLGPHGDAVIEVHHAKVQIASMEGGHITRLADLVCLCANCHRIVHREMAATA